MSKSKGAYNTHARRILIEYLTTVSDRTLTPSQIYAGLAEYTGRGAELPGKSTVYRLLSQLCDEGIIKKFSSVKASCSHCSHTDGSGGLYVYQYSPDTDCSTHLHIRCLLCDKTVHATDDGELSALADALMERHGFELSDGQTVLYGICPVCKRSGH